MGRRLVRSLQTTWLGSEGGGTLIEARKFGDEVARLERSGTGILKQSSE